VHPQKSYRGPGLRPAATRPYAAGDRDTSFAARHRSRVAVVNIRPDRVIAEQLGHREGRTGAQALPAPAYRTCPRAGARSGFRNAPPAPVPLVAQARGLPSIATAESSDGRPTG
jgi:hypothetical protein